MRGAKTFGATAASQRQVRNALCAWLWCFLSFPLHAQTLARPGWAGSGLSAETWWRNAVFYRISPATFQDSDGDGKGDLRGIAQRMSYLQSLAVDAIVLEDPVDDTGFDDLISEASRRHIRLLVTVSAQGSNDLVSTARSWLTRGCAGVWLSVPAKADALQTANAVRALRKLTDSFPGQRILVEDTSADPAVLPAPGAQLVTKALMAGIGGHIDALSLRVQLAQLDSVPPGSAPLILLHGGAVDTEEDRKHHDDLQRMLAAALLLSRGAAALDAGQEIDRPTTSSTTRIMQWTPSNLTRQAAVEAAPTPPPQPRRENEYGAYVPYVAPKKPAPSAGDQPDLNALLGFSSLPIATVPEEKANNVAAEDEDAHSLLNFYRRLSQLHHEDVTLRLGGTTLLNRDAGNVLAWVRNAPSSARTSTSVFIACNLSDSTKTLSFDPASAAKSTRGASLHPLLTSSSTNAQYVQSPSAVTVAPWSVVVLSFAH